MIVAGFDEAGYGPKLGPLVVGWTAFEVPGARLGQPVDLWRLLDHAVRRECKGDAAKLWVADSKAIKPKKNGLKNLELGVLAFLGREEACTVPELLTLLGEGTQLERQLWFQDLPDVTVPAYAWSGEVAARAHRLAEACTKSGVRCVGSGVRVLDAYHYNQRIAATQNKGAVLGETCVQLLKAMRASTRGPLDVTLDKHGGRSRYLRLLGRAFPMCALDIIEEGLEASLYHVKTPQGEVRVAFRKSAEDHSLPVALASMHCKYLRELLMDRFNAWFQARIPGVKKTAGYAQDAGRFLNDVGAKLPGLGVTLDTLVRAR